LYLNVTLIKHIPFIFTMNESEFEKDESFVVQAIAEHSKINDLQQALNDHFNNKYSKVLDKFLKRQFDDVQVEFRSENVPSVFLYKCASSEIHV